MFEDPGLRVSGLMPFLGLRGPAETLGAFWRPPGTSRDVRPSRGTASSGVEIVQCHCYKPPQP
eukprot:1013040-Pyramimonas_sp.AAC.1